MYPFNMNTQNEIVSPVSLSVYLNKTLTLYQMDLVAQQLTQQLVLPTMIVHGKLSSGSTNPPGRTIQYYYRIVSIMKKLIERPCGVKKVSSFYKVKRTDRVKPPVIRLFSKNKARVILKLLKQHQYLCTNAKGYYTSAKGKALLLKHCQ